MNRIKAKGLIASKVGGSADLVKYLISEGADPHLRNSQHGRTPLHVLAADSASTFLFLRLFLSASHHLYLCILV